MPAEGLHEPFVYPSPINPEVQDLLPNKEFQQQLWGKVHKDLRQLFLAFNPIDMSSYVLGSICIDMFRIGLGTKDLLRTDGQIDADGTLHVKATFGENGRCNLQFCWPLQEGVIRSMSITRDGCEDLFFVVLPQTEVEQDAYLDGLNAKADVTNLQYSRNQTYITVSGPNIVTDFMHVTDVEQGNNTRYSLWMNVCE